jgi:tRNA threonylcarbamoyl adenosine modification protein YeaZ
VIFVIDTSSAVSAVALLAPSGRIEYEDVAPSGPGFDLPSRYRALMDGPALTKVAVAAGPGSFTGLRVGVSFGLGLAVGLRIPIVSLATLELQAARADGPVVALSEAGRGRVYYQAPDGRRAAAEPGEVPREIPAVGWLRPATQSALEAAGVRFQADSELRSFGAAAARLLETAREVAYGSLKVEYMQTFKARI